MILQALTDYHDRLQQQGVLPKWGWGQVGISVDVCLDSDGRILRLVNTQHSEQRGKKTVECPNTLVMPAPAERTVNVAANFLWDNGEYILGLTLKGKKDRARTYFDAARTLHETVLTEVDSAMARSILAFFRTWNPDNASDLQDLDALMPILLKGGNLTFCDASGSRAANDPGIQAAWDRYFEGSVDGPSDVCIITGEHTDHIALTHPKIKGVPGTQSSGAALVSYNAPAFTSFGREQNANAPVSARAAHAYTAALNYLLKQKDSVMQMGTTTVVMWSASTQSAYPDFLSNVFDMDGPYTEEDLQGMLARIARGEAVEYCDAQLDSNMPFYVLGLSPNAGRISVRFFLQNTFGAFVRNVNAHQQDLRIAGYDHAEDKIMSVGKILSATINRNSKDAMPQPLLSGDLMRAILEGTRYPTTLLTGINLRMRAERRIGHTRAAILKAYYTRNRSPQVPEEILNVNLNSESECIPYLLGRMFSLYEAAQCAANPDIKATIMDRYFTSAASIPATVFPQLGSLAQKHLRKLKGDPKKSGIGYRLAEQITELGSRIGEAYPVRLSLPEQGSFQLGYYHETQARYAPRKKGAKKTETEE